MHNWQSIWSQSVEILWCMHCICKIKFNFHGELSLWVFLYPGSCRTSSRSQPKWVAVINVNRLNYDINLLLWFLLLALHKLKLGFDALIRTPFNTEENLYLFESSTLVLGVDIYRHRVYARCKIRCYSVERNVYRSALYELSMNYDNDI